MNDEATSKASQVHEIVAEYRKGLTGILGDELDAILLFGSQARGDAEDASDIDILCVMKSPFDYGELIRKTSELTASVSLKHEAVISRVFVTREDYETKQTPFLMNVRAEGVLA